MPRDDLLRLLRSHITRALIQHYSNPSYNIFDGLVQLLQSNWDTSPTTIAEIRQTKNTKAKGDLFEHFALLYFQHCYHSATNVWLLNDAPQSVLDLLGLRRNDLGIDLILKHTGPKNTFSAIQVKYRKPPTYKSTWGVSWKDLSTFYALVNRTGPYHKHIVFTNSHWARHVGGRKTKTDQSICIGTLRKISIEQWQAMAALKGHSLRDSTGPVPVHVPAPVSVPVPVPMPVPVPVPVPALVPVPVPVPVPVLLPPKICIKSTAVPRTPSREELRELRLRRLQPQSQPQLLQPQLQLQSQSQLPAVPQTDAFSRTG